MAAYSWNLIEPYKHQTPAIPYSGGWVKLAPVSPGTWWLVLGVGWAHVIPRTAHSYRNTASLLIAINSMAVHIIAHPREIWTDSDAP